MARVLPLHMTLHRLFISILAMTTSATMAAVTPATVEQRLATELIRTALGPVNTDLLNTPGLEASKLLTHEALALDPQNPELWRFALGLGLLAEDRELKNLAVQTLAKLDPSDEVVRLLRIQMALDRYQTFEERSAAVETLLSEANVPRLGEAVASRLALDFALLHQRQGDIASFSKWLSKALAWDRSNRAAAAIAAGFFRMNVKDAHAEAELLVNLMMADPTDVPTQIALAQLLLEHGAYAGADRIYGLALNGLDMEEKTGPNDLLTDHALSMWANGKARDAIELLERRRAQVDRLFQYYVARSTPGLMPQEIESVRAPLEPNMTLTEAIIRMDVDASAATEWVTRVMLSHDMMMKQLKEHAVPPDAAAAPPDPRHIAQLHLEKVWAGLWLGADLEVVQSSLAAAEEIQPLSASARQRFDGWLAFRRGELDRAVELLTPLAGEDISARLGLALALEQRGDRREAAREFLTIIRTQPGSLITVWSIRRMEKTLGQPMPGSDLAMKLNRLIQSVPAEFDRYVADASMALSVRIVPQKPTFAPYEPVILNVEITNVSQFPLGIDRNGPLRPQLLLFPSAQIGDLRPAIIDFGRKLRLRPREKIAFSIDLRQQMAGDMLNQSALNGSIVKLIAFVNFHIDPEGVPKPGLYGVRADVPLVRIDGARLTDEWVAETTNLLNSGRGEDPVERMALLSFRIAPRLPFNISAEDRQRVEDVRRALAERFAKLDPHAQAWLLSVMVRGQGPAVEGVESILTMARQSEHRLVILSYLLFHTSGPDDPMMDAAKRSDDPVVKRLGNLIQSTPQATEGAGTTGP